MWGRVSRMTSPVGVLRKTDLCHETLETFQLYIRRRGRENMMIASRDWTTQRRKRSENEI